MRSILHITALAIVLGACGPSGGSGPGDGDDGDGTGDDGTGDDGTGDGGDDGGGDGDGSGGEAGDPCETAQDCRGDLVCNPANDECADGLPCSTHTECGGAAYCDGTTCTPNESGGECDDSINCVSGETCVSGHCGCEGVAFQAEPVTPNMLIVLDRSESMNETIGGQSKWNIARSSINGILGEFGPTVRFGLSMFASRNNPGGFACNPGDVDVGVGDNTAAAIQSSIQSTDAETNTPIGDTLDAMVGYSGLADATRPNYILLITDGAENCFGDGVGAVRDLRQQTPEVKTFVVGFGGAVDAGELNQMATEGGTALPTNPKYYQADDAAALAAAFDSIIGTVLSCSYDLDQVPEDPDELYIYLDGVAVARDPAHANGWDYDPATNRVTFYGAACDTLQSGEVTDLVIVYGCASDPVD